MASIQSSGRTIPFENIIGTLLSSDSDLNLLNINFNPTISAADGADDFWKVRVTLTLTQWTKCNPSQHSHTATYKLIIYDLTKLFNP